MGNPDPANHVSQQRSFWLGDIDLTAATKYAESEVWGPEAPRCADKETTEFLFELELKAHDEALEAYRIALKQADAILVFGGAAMAWLATFIATAPLMARCLATGAELAAALAILFAFLSRRAILRPALISFPHALRAVNARDKTSSREEVTIARDWVARTMHVGRRRSRDVVDHIAKRVAIASWAIGLAAVLGGLAIAFR